MRKLLLGLPLVGVALLVGLNGLPVGPVAAQPKAKGYLPEGLVEPYQRLLKGNYEEAREQFLAAIESDKELLPLATVGIARSYQELGEYEAALEKVNKALEKAKDHPDLLAARADLYFQTGRWEEAEKEANAAIAKQDDQLLARWTLARLARDRGELEKADQAVRWIVRYYTARNNADNEITNPWELLIVAEAGAENARWNNLSRQFAFILNEVISDALKEEKNFWPGEVMAGSMLLEKYNRPDAVDAFDKALKINPKSADAFAGKALAALQKFDIKDAHGYAEQALKINPKHVHTLRIKAQIALIAADYDQAADYLETARMVNPKDAAVLGRLAGVAKLRGDDDKLAKLIAEVETFDQKPGVFYFELGECMDDTKRYLDAEQYFDKSVQLRPNLAPPRTSLGLLHLRMGREDKGREILTRANKLDPFNVRVANQLKVLRHLDSYETITTPHYEVRFNPQTDKVLATLLAEYLETTHVELKNQFQFEPPERTLVELFSTHEMFSGRTVGLPDLHTIGACTGRVVAMASPRAKGVNKPFNWARVIRHELTHIFNLSQTNFLCPHWLTEGLAVRNENMDRPLMWLQILRDRYRADTLFTLDDVMLGFVRPKGPDDWSLAYCQSEIYVSYMIDEYGEESVAKVLDAYGRGLGTGSVIEKSLGVSQAEFEKGYKKYIREKVLGTALDAPDEKSWKPMTFAEMEKAYAEDEDDLELAARLAEQLVRRNQSTKAKSIAEKVVEKQKDHVVANIVLARLKVAAKEPDEGLAILETVAETQPDDPHLLRELTRAYVGMEKIEDAIRVCEHGRKVAPLEGAWVEHLARLYKLSDNNEGLVSVLKEIVSRNPDDLDARIKLAESAIEAKETDTALLYAWEAVHIDPLNKTAQSMLLVALKAAEQADEAERLTKMFGQ